MSFEFVCPYCHSRSLVDDRFAGLSGPCAECGKPVTMPGGPSGQALTSKSDSLDRSEFLPNRTRARLSPLAIPNKKIRALILSGAGIALATILFAFASYSIFKPMVQQGITRRGLMQSSSNMRQIVKALNSYRFEHGRYPDPIVRDASGKPLYSWRVTLLPYLGYNALFASFQKDQPWDSPANISLVDRMPSIYSSPSMDRIGLGQYANYAYVIGKGTLFPTGRSLDPNSIYDLDQNTVILVETADNGMAWSEPWDIDVTSGLKIGKKGGIEAGGNFDQLALMATIDEVILKVEESVSASELQTLFSPSDMDSVASDYIKPFP
jgi:hypothetical protein